MKVKTLTSSGVSYLIEKVRSILLPTEYVYYVKLESNKQYTLSIPDFDANKSQVDIYLNGLRLAITADYTLDETGTVTLLTQTIGNDNHVLILHRKWEG